MGDKWIISKINNLDYVKNNALVTMFNNSDGTQAGVINGYIDDSGSWLGYISKSSDIAGSPTPHKIDYGLMSSLPSIFEGGSSVVDFGCGNADYVKNLIKNNFRCEAYDGNPNTPEMTDGIGKVLDLSKEFDLGKTFDYVMSLEVAEHIPKECEEVYVDNLIRHTGFYLITSWAVVGQGGDGHVNEQDEDYVLNMYKEKGMIYNKEVSEVLRNVATLGWFKNTIYVFSKEDN
jgi:2-polyprenyl-3-methyl-5-hydroxy-6-metoxy-1,4-benzoquinol methylase